MFISEMGKNSWVWKKMEKQIMNCPPRCGLCCGVVPLPAKVYDANKDKANEFIEEQRDDFGHIYVTTESGWCVFLDENKRCKIYEDRPDVCRDYGEIDEMSCVLYRKDGTKRNRQERRRVTREIDKHIDKVISKLRREYGDTININDVSSD